VTSGPEPEGEPSLPHERGELGLALSTKVLGGKAKVLMRFSTPISWAALTPEQAERFARDLSDTAQRARRMGG
jgi:hypothetical protein